MRNHDRRADSIPTRKRRSKPAASKLPRIRNDYDAAQMGRRLRIWQPAMVGPNAAILGDLNLVRARSRDATRNNGWISHGIKNYVANEIGCGIVPEPMSPYPDFNKAAKELWDEWTPVADADGVQDFYGMLSLASRGRIEAGEMFIRIRARNLKDDLPVPFQLQMLEPEFCPHDFTEFGKGRTIRAGIEFDGLGRRRAYWMFQSNPNDTGFNIDLRQDRVPVPATSVIHHFAPLRAGQVRGVPWTVQALIKAKDFDEYDDAELVRKKIKSAYTGAIQRELPDTDDAASWEFDPMTGIKLEKDASGVPIANVESGSFVSLMLGEELKLFEGDVTGQGYADFVRQQLLGVAASLDVPYEFLTGDMAKVNDRLMRVILNEYHRIVEQTQWHLVIPQVCIPVWENFVDFAVLAGILDAPGYETERVQYLKTQWSTHRWPYLNPLQDVQAAGLEIKYGLQSRTGAAAERGQVAEDIDAQNQKDKQRAEAAGLYYETHPNGPTAAGGGSPDANPPDPNQGY